MTRCLRGICRWFGPLALVAALTSGSFAAAAAGQWVDPPEVQYHNLPYNGQFTFARIRFTPTNWRPTGAQAWGLDLSWNHDYPRADQRLPEILELVTGVQPNLGGSTIVSLTDPELFQYPWAYLCEVGALTLTEEEVANLRAYLLKGGFVVVDDFTGYHWYNFEEQMQRVIPGAQWVEIDQLHPIFNVFFEIDDLSFGVRQYGFRRGFRGYDYPRYLALFEDNDPTQRILMIANYDNDIGEYWEWAESGYISIDLTNQAYKLGVNYVIYSMTH